MRRINRDSLPHLLDCYLRQPEGLWSGWLARLTALWWGTYGPLA